MKAPSVGMEPVRPANIFYNFNYKYLHPFSQWLNTDKMRSADVYKGGFPWFSRVRHIPASRLAPVPLPIYNNVIRTPALPAEQESDMLVKICGLTRVEEAGYLNENGADLAGFVLFFPKSKRNITIQEALPIMEALDSSIRKVAVVVSPDAAQLSAIADAGFDFVQVHGQLPEELLAQVRLPVLKAFNVSDMDQYEYYRSRPEIAGYVFDAQEPGSGAVFDWKLVTSVPRDEKLLILAGGLHPGNVAEAVLTLHPDGVDVSSGVEYVDYSDDGVSGGIFRGKDPDRVAAFLKAARSAEEKE